MLGKCFFAKELYSEAQNQFHTALQRYELSGDALAKELQYNLGLTLEKQGKLAEATESYSRIVQEDYQYLDAAERLGSLRRKVEADEAQQ